MAHECTDRSAPAQNLGRTWSPQKPTFKFMVDFSSPLFHSLSLLHHYILWSILIQDQVIACNNITIIIIILAYNFNVTSSWQIQFAVRLVYKMSGCGECVQYVYNIRIIISMQIDGITHHFPLSLCAINFSIPVNSNVFMIVNAFAIVYTRIRDCT